MVVVEQHDPDAVRREVECERQADRPGADHRDRMTRRRFGAVIGGAPVGELLRLEVDRSTSKLLNLRACSHISVSRAAVQMRGSTWPVASS